MPYYGAGDYYRGGYRAGDNYAAGSIFGAIGRGIKSIARGVIAATPVGQMINSIAPPSTTIQGRSMIPVPGITGTMQRMVPGGESGFRLGKSRRMNAGNAKAARRAIRRIKSVRQMLQSIERELPRRPAQRIGGSRGVITRAEAARALRG